MMALENRRGFNECPETEGFDEHVDGLVDGKLAAADEFVAWGRDGVGELESIFIVVSPVGGMELCPKHRWVQIKDDRPSTVMRHARARASWLRLLMKILGTLRIDGEWIIRRDLAGESHEGDPDTWHHGGEWKFAVKDGAVVDEEELTPVVNDELADGATD